MHRFKIVVFLIYEYLPHFIEIKLVQKFRLTSLYLINYMVLLGTL